MTDPVRVMFVCSGNICRSPTAEVVLRAQAAAAGTEIEVVSSGIGAWHVGDDMDRRSRETLTDAGYIPARHVARQFAPRDFADHDVVVALDAGHERALHELADLADDPAAAHDSIVRLRSYDADLAPGEPPDVGDPYYGGPDGFTEVLAQIERSSAGLLADLAGRSGGRQQADRPPR